MVKCFVLLVTDLDIFDHLCIQFLRPTGKPSTAELPCVNREAVEFPGQKSRANAESQMNSSK